MFGKALSTHGALVDGIQNTMDGAGVNLPDAYLFLHGSTIAINTLLERNGANTALLITEGFRDIYEIGRVNRPDAYNLFFSKHEPLVKRSSRFEVRSDCLRTAACTRSSTKTAVRALARSLKERGIESVAVLLLHSYRNPAHESRVKEIVQRGDARRICVGIARAVAGVSRVRACLHRRRQRLCGPARIGSIWRSSSST